MSDIFLKQAAHSGLYYLPAAQRPALETLARQHHLPLLSANLTGTTVLGDVLRQFGKALHFPRWYGANLDALFDCLTDPTWLPGKPHVLLIDGLDALCHGDPEGFATLLEVFIAAAESCRDAAQPLWVLLDTPVDGVATLANA